MPIAPPAARHALADTGDSLLITIPARKNIPTMLFSGVWLLGWAVGETFVLGMIVSGFINNGIKSITLAGLPAALFVLFWVTGWTVGGIVVFSGLLWQIAGKEIITITRETLTTKRAVAGISFPKEHSAQHIKDLRIATPTWNDFHLRTSGNPHGTEMLAFDYGARTFHFAPGLDEAEAKQILAAILKRFPQYGSATPQV